MVLAVVATFGMALAAVNITRARTAEHALATFRSAREQLKRSLSLRYQAFEAVSDLSFVMDVVRQVADHRDEADFGFGTEADDARQLEELHQNLLDSDWDWAKAAGEGFFGITDYKGRILYSQAAMDAFGDTALPLRAVAQAYDGEAGYRGAMVLRGDEPTLARTRLLKTPSPELFVLYARATVLNGEPRAVFVQGVRVQKLLDDVALADEGTRLALVAPDGSHTGGVPSEVVRAGMALGESDAPRHVDAGGESWLVQSYPLPGLSGSTPIARMIVARNLDVGLAVLRTAPAALWAASIALLALAVAGAVVLSGRLSRPVQELEGAARKVQGGSLDVAVTVRGHDELARLGEAFNAMTEGLRDRDRIMRTFKKYLAPEVVDYLLAHPEAQRLGGERRRLTVLFADVVGFTTLSEKLAPETVVALLNGFLARASRRINARGGTVDKYLGDAIMAFFGAPIPREDHPARACLAALDVLSVLDEVRAQWAEHGAPLQLRLGLNTGEVLLGNIGGEEGQDYTVIGDAVNLASRLEGANKEYGTRILISEAVHAEAKEAVDAREVDLLRVKGKAVPVRIYELLGERGFLAAHPQKQRVVETFVEGLAHYRGRAFTEAVRAFEAALAIDPGDGPSRTLLARARAYEATPPSADPWDGVFELATK